MITDLTIQGLRGIKEGSLEGLTPLTLLLGPNGSGKSTILEALLLGGSPMPGDAAGRVVTRRPGVEKWPRWLFWRGPDRGQTTISIRIDEHSVDWTRVYLLDHQRRPDVILCYHADDSTTRSWTQIANGGHQHGSFDTKGEMAPGPYVQQLPCSDVRLINPAGIADEPLHELYSKVSRKGGRQEVTELVGSLLAGLDRLEILTEGDTPVLHTSFSDRSVPAALAGDGVAALLRLAMQVVGHTEDMPSVDERTDNPNVAATLPNWPQRVALVEEPEAHQHPRAIAMSAQVLAEAVKRGVQVIASTHSMEFVDHLLNVLYPDDLHRLSLWRTRLDNGTLRTSRLSGAEVADARQAIAEDLR